MVAGLNFDTVMIHFITGLIAMLYSPKFDSLSQLLSVGLLFASWVKYPLVWKTHRGPLWCRWYTLGLASLLLGTIAQKKLNDGFFWVVYKNEPVNQ